MITETMDDTMIFARIEPLTPAEMVEPGRYGFVRGDRIILQVQVTEPTPRAELIQEVRTRARQLLSGDGDAT